MKDTITNKLNRFVTTLGVADDPPFLDLWQNQPPAAFGKTITLIRPQLVALQS